MIFVKLFSQVVCLCSLLVVSNGCMINKTDYGSLQGNCKVNQANHVLHLWTSIENPSEKVYHGPRPKDFYQSNQENAFVLNIAGKQKPIFFDSLVSNYQYSSESFQPLELAYLDKTNAVLIPKAHLVHYAIEPGQYKINLNYVINGETNSCQFDLKYEIKAKYEVFSVFGLWRAYHGGGGP
jgi:hypothetical protein